MVNNSPVSFKLIPGELDDIQKESLEFAVKEPVNFSQQYAANNKIPEKRVLQSLLAYFGRIAYAHYGFEFALQAVVENEGPLRIRQYMRVVEEVTNEHRQLSIENARKLVPDCKVGEIICTDVPVIYPTEGGFLPRTYIRNVQIEPLDP